MLGTCTSNNSFLQNNDDKGFEMCTADLEFESGRASLVRASNSRSFTRSPEPIKCTFREVGISSNPKRKKEKKKKMRGKHSFNYFFLNNTS
jgi:hypothetical protein